MPLSTERRREIENKLEYFHYHCCKKLFASVLQYSPQSQSPFGEYQTESCSTTHLLELPVGRTEREECV